MINRHLYFRIVVAKTTNLCIWIHLHCSSKKKSVNRDVLESVLGNLVYLKVLILLSVYVVRRKLINYFKMWHFWWTFNSLRSSRLWISFALNVFYTLLDQSFCSVCRILIFSFNTETIYSSKLLVTTYKNNWAIKQKPQILFLIKVKSQNFNYGKF